MGGFMEVLREIWMETAWNFDVIKKDISDIKNFFWRSWIKKWRKCLKLGLCVQLDFFLGFLEDISPPHQKDLIYELII